jgi:hypothetical protein
MMKIRLLLAGYALALAIPAFAQEEPVIKEGQENVGSLVEALTPKPEVRMRGIKILRQEPGSPSRPIPRS